MGADLLGQEEKVAVPRGSIARWAERYGYGIRQIKNWKALGAPFDEPEKMVAWAEANLERVPGRLVEAVAKLVSPGPSTEGKPVAAPVLPRELPDVSGTALGVEADLERFRVTLARIHVLYDEALKGQRFTDANRYLEQAQKVSGEIRQLERLLPTVKEQAGEWMRTGEVRRATTEFLMVLYRALQGRGARAAAALREAEGDAGLVRAWKDEIGEVFRSCCQGDFTEVLELEG